MKKVRVKSTGLEANVTALFDNDGNFVGFKDAEEIEGTQLIWPADAIEPLEPNWEELRIRFAEDALREIIRYDQGANSPEDSADLAMGYSNALVEKLKEQFEKRCEGKDDD